MNNDRYEEAKQLFPITREELDQIYLPNISDALHSDDAIKSVIYIIQNRNRGMVGFDEEKSFMDEADTRLKDSPDSVNLPHRKKYDALISLIDTDTVANLEEQFEKYTWNFIDNILGIVHGYRKQEQKARRKIHRLLKSQINNVENASKQFFSPLMVGINTEGELDFLFDMHDSAQQLREADEELGECEAKANSLYRLILVFRNDALNRSHYMDGENETNIYSLMFVLETGVPGETVKTVLHNGTVLNSTDQSVFPTPVIESDYSGWEFDKWSYSYSNGGTVYTAEVDNAGLLNAIKTAPNNAEIIVTAVLKVKSS